MRVSVITPTFNHAPFIRQCVDSVLAQTCGDWEQIIVDDCSTDRTAEIVRSYKDSRIRLVSNTTRNGLEYLQRTYNQALAMATGDYVAILEGDDYWPPSKLANQLPAFAHEKVVLTWGRIAHDYGGHVNEDPQRGDTIPLDQFENVTQWLLVRNDIGAVTVMVRKSALDAIGGFYQTPGTVMVDYSTWLRLSTVGEFRYVQSLSGFWRQHPEQTTRVNRANLLWSHIAICRDFLRTQGPKSATSLQSDFCQAAMAYYEGQVEHINGNKWRAIRLYLAAIPKIHRIDRLALFKCFVKAVLWCPLKY
jgi:glycosyltransferase involved in cell wall biosynthesis